MMLGREGSTELEVSSFTELALTRRRLAETYGITARVTVAA